MSQHTDPDVHTEPRSAYRDRLRKVRVTEGAPRPRVALPSRIRVWRAQAGLTQAQVAALAGTSTARISRMENGALPEPVELLVRLGIAREGPA